MKISDWSAVRVKAEKFEEVEFDNLVTEENLRQFSIFRGKRIWSPKKELSRKEVMHLHLRGLSPRRDLLTELKKFLRMFLWGKSGTFLWPPQVRRELLRGCPWLEPTLERDQRAFGVLFRKSPQPEELALCPILP
jgi:hypothetical protein